ncbi:MAG: hypothetical protein E3J46_05020 [Desulfobacteraceae bacterium]|nr:MAG: hypothetical protein E3J46_05020 [Desulfobacteraceae bacterium]
MPLIPSEESRGIRGMALWRDPEAVPHRHFVFSIPKILRRHFLYDRSLLSGLSRCGWEALKEFFQETVPEEDAVPGAVIAISRCKRDDFLGFNPHLHILCSDGCFYGEGMFRVAPRFETKQLEEIFRHNVFPAMRGTPFQMIKKRDEKGANNT